MPRGRGGRGHGGRGGRGGGSGGRGGGGGEAGGREVTTSKAMSYLLRHGAEKEGVKIDEGGWVRVQDMLSWPRLRSRKVTFLELRDIVATNAKQRFTLLYSPYIKSSATTTTTASKPPSDPSQTSQTSATPHSEPPSPSPTTNIPESDDPSDYLIRASQGHSLAIISSESLLHPITLEEILEKGPRMVVHGTYAKAWKSIQKTGGISRMSRGHVHFSTGVPLIVVVVPPAGALAKAPEKEQKEGEGEEKEKNLGVDGLSNGIDDLSLTDNNKEEDKAKAEEGDDNDTPSTAPSPASATATAAAAPASDTTIPTNAVISGMRKDCTHLIWVDIIKSMQEGGLKWWRSENGVILSEGNEAGLVRVEFVDRVEERKTGKVVWRTRGSEQG